MTGIEQLRKLGADAVRGGEIGRAICDITDQIERETEEESARLYDARVDEETDVCDLFGVVPLDDPLTSLRRHVEGLNDTVENLRLELGEARDDAAWVREHGGLEEVRRMFQDADNRRVELCAALGIGLDRGWSDAMAAMRLRLMPEGMCWPVFEDGTPVKFGDVVSDGDETGRVYYVTFDTVNPVIIGFTDEEPDRDPGTWLEVSVNDGERVNRPAPKVLDADGVPINEGEELWDIDTGAHGEVVYAHDYDGMSVKFAGVWHYPERCTHRAPVLAADGKPLREGETVWLITSGREIRVDKIEHRPEGFWALELFADGSKRHSAPVSILAHERPDSFEQLEKDANDLIYDIGFHLGDYSPSDFKEKGDSVQDRVRDLVRRAKKLAGVGE